MNVWYWDADLGQYDLVMHVGFTDWHLVLSSQYLFANHTNLFTFIVTYRWEVTAFTVTKKADSSSIVADDDSKNGDIPEILAWHFGKQNGGCISRLVVLMFQKKSSASMNAHLDIGTLLKQSDTLLLIAWVKFLLREQAGIRAHIWSKAATCARITYIHAHASNTQLCSWTNC